MVSTRISIRLLIANNSQLSLLSNITTLYRYAMKRGHGGGKLDLSILGHDFCMECVLQGGDLRYCQKCSHYKPPRAHHCRVCQRCVLRMVCMCVCVWVCVDMFHKILDNVLKCFLFYCKDHHCIWINNCVGHANYKVFFIFVVYAVIACIYSLVSYKMFILSTEFSFSLVILGLYCLRYYSTSY